MKPVIHLRTYTLNDACNDLLTALERRDMCDRSYRKSPDFESGHVNREWVSIYNREAAHASKDVDHILNLIQAAEDRGDHQLAAQLRGEVDAWQADPADPEEEEE